MCWATESVNMITKIIYTVFYTARVCLLTILFTFIGLKGQIELFNIC